MHGAPRANAGFSLLLGRPALPFALVLAAFLATSATPATAGQCSLAASGESMVLALPHDLLENIHPLADPHSALVATRGGWVMRLNLAQARITAQVKVADEIHATALSVQHAGIPVVLAVVTQVPNSLLMLDEWLKPLQTLHLTDKTGKIPSAVLGIETAPIRQSFVLALKDVPELWEISFNPHTPEISLGLVHDFQYREGQFISGYLNPKRITLDSLPLDFALVDGGHAVLTRHAKPNQPNSSAVSVTHLDVRRQVATMPVPPWPSLRTPPDLPWTCRP